ncbi:MAG: hypothetical protein M0Z52_13055 [Actinomycetota bacterium]|nr:hypothetical protein [Actinomycetota bacterium]
MAQKTIRPVEIDQKKADYKGRHQEWNHEKILDITEKSARGAVVERDRTRGATPQPRQTSTSCGQLECATSTIMGSSRNPADRTARRVTILNPWTG